MVHTLPTGIRRFAALVLILCTVNQPANTFGFEKPSSTAEQVQLATAVLSLPLAIAAQEHPDSQALACLNHAIKAVNEFVACSNTNAFYNGPWFLYDTYKTVDCLGNLLDGTTGADQADANVDLEEPDKDDATQVEADDATDLAAATGLSRHSSAGATADDGAPTPNAGKRHINRIARTLLASAEGVLRILVALRNNKGVSDIEKNYLAWYNTLLSSYGSLARTANNCLSDTNNHKNYAQILLCAHLISSYCAYAGYQSAARLFEAEQEQKRIEAEREAAVRAAVRAMEEEGRAREAAAMDRLHALSEQKKPILETNDVATVFEAFWISKKNEEYLIEENKFSDDVDAFCRQNHLPPIFTWPEGQGRGGPIEKDDIKNLFDTLFIPWFRRRVHDEQQKNSATPIPLETVKMPLRNYGAQGFQQVFGEWGAQAFGQIPGFSSQAMPADGHPTPNQPTQPNRLAEAECLQRLGLSATATLDEIKQKYYTLTKTVHPDKNHAQTATQEQQQLNEAYHEITTNYRANESTKRPTRATTPELQSQSLDGVD
jgi:hypothetical protein